MSQVSDVDFELFLSSVTAPSASAPILQAVVNDSTLVKRAGRLGQTLLLKACAASNIELAQALLVYLSDIRQRKDDGWDAIIGVLLALPQPSHGRFTTHQRRQCKFTQ